MKSLRSLALIPLAVAAACARHSGEVAGLQLSDIPLFETRIDIATGSFDHADFRVADFDGDGQFDMAVLSVTGQLRILLGNGTSFVVGQSLQVQGRPWWIAGADLDGDQDEDLVVLSSEPGTAQVWLNNGSGTFEQGQAIETDVDALALAIGDFDGDERQDLVISRPDAAELAVAFGNGDGTFGDQQNLTLPGGGLAFTVCAGDATRDGVDDLIVSDPQTGRVLIYDGLPRGYFGDSFCELRVGSGPSACSLGDLSGDGLPDIVVSAVEGNRYVVITDILGPVGQGKGKALDATLSGGLDLPFLRECEYLSFDIPVSGRAALSVIADVTGDGLPDLIGCLQFENQVVVAPQVIDGDYSEQFQLDTLGRATRPVVLDVDANGKNDLLVLSALADRINLWLARDSGRLAGGRNYSSGLQGSNWIESADFDGDGDVEIAAGSVEDSRVSFLGRGGDDALVVETIVDIGAPVRQLKSADLDGDGRVDLVVGIDGGVRILRNRSTGGTYDFEQVVAPLTLAGSAIPFGIAVADLDRDGDFDLVVCDVAGGGLHLLPGTPTPFVFDAPTVIDLGGGPADVANADFTGDGLQDLAVSRYNQADILVLRNDGGLAFSSLLNVPVGDNPNYLVTADFNRDGRADLVVSNSASGTISVLFGSGNGFSGQSYPAGLGPTALMAQDLSGDGVPDILVTSLVGGDFRVMVGDGQGGFPTLPTFPGTAGATDALLQDMTGDGLADLLIGSILGNRISLVRNITEN